MTLFTVVATGGDGLFTGNFGYLQLHLTYLWKLSVSPAHVV